jgi:hypothetical protein
VEFHRAQTHLDKQSRHWLSTAADTLLSNAYFKHAGERSNVTSPSLAATPVRERTRAVTPVPATAVRAEPAFGAPAPPGRGRPRVVLVDDGPPPFDPPAPVSPLFDEGIDPAATPTARVVMDIDMDMDMDTKVNLDVDDDEDLDDSVDLDGDEDFDDGVDLDVDAGERVRAGAGAGAPGGDAGLLPDPRPLAETLARCVVEVLAGTRDIDQIARWLSTDVHAHLMKRVVLARRARALRDESPGRFAFTMGSTVLCEPSAGVVEAVVIVHGRARSRAVALRLEALGPRWRASAVHVL